MTWFFKLLEQMSPQIVEALKEALEVVLQNLYEQALKTENKWDDMGIEMLAKVLGIELEEPE